MTATATRATLEIRDLKVRYGEVEAVRGAELSVNRGEIVAVIGESGSGKSSLALSAARLLPPGTAVEGEILLDGTDCLELTGPELAALRGDRIGYVPQDAMAALNPVMTIGRQVAEVFLLHRDLDRREATRLATEALDRVKIREPGKVMNLYPHQLSGGMRQRVLIAIAMALEPALLIADEPTTALDASVQAEIVSLIRELCRSAETAVLWVTHDMGVVAEIADSISVMYAGRIVESGPARDLFDDPRHPYTAALISTLADMNHGGHGQPLFEIPGQPAAANSPVPGCRFHPRCPNAGEICTSDDPAMSREGARAWACHFPCGPSGNGAAR